MILKIRVNSLVLAVADVATASLPWQAGLRYGLLGLPLAFAALALYVVLPHYYADQLGLALWLVAGLLLTSVVHSQLVIAHQAWGVRLGGDAVQRSRIVAWREGLGLVGVIAASALSVAWGPAAMLAVLALTLALGWWALCYAPRPPKALRPSGLGQTGAPALWAPLRVAAFRRFGLERTWLAGMLLAVLCFGWTAGLGSGQVLAFAVICALTGVALGADLAVPGGLLARLVEPQGEQGQHDGAYLGWWNLATKLNLALAAGAALPLLQWAGYAPGSQDLQALAHLSWGYALLPCALKLLAAALLYGLFIHRVEHPQPPEGMLL